MDVIAEVRLPVFIVVTSLRPPAGVSGGLDQQPSRVEASGWLQTLPGPVRAVYEAGSTRLRAGTPFGPLRKPDESGQRAPRIKGRHTGRGARRTPRADL